MMITVQKEDVATWLVAEYLAASHATNEKIRLYERKYSRTWEEFSEAVEKAPDEDFDQWDDYIEWKACVKVAEELAFKIHEVRLGNFEVT